MSAAARALARARAAGLRLRLTPDGTVKVQADRPPPDALLNELRQWRHDIARLLAAQDIRSEPGTSELGVVWNDHEREAMLAHYAEPPSDRPYKPSDADEYRAGLLVSALMRPPSWSNSTPPPPKGAWCSCCGRNRQSGGRWWRPRRPRSDGLGLGPGWRCWRCHPPPDPSEAEVVET
jgi:hypothetical protein